ncbi:MAG TPA: antibiotic biosynthesis monooxygenase [Thermoanaerobaculia bacterium]|jgi:heme-degrading monooxygenase HmoA
MKKTFLLISVLLFAAQCATTPTASTNPARRIARMWRGEVPVARANEYEQYLKAEGISKLRAIPGNLGVDTFRRTVGEREEFLVISYWPSEEHIRAYAGEDVTKTRLMPRDLEYLIEPEYRVRHYNIVP